MGFSVKLDCNVFWFGPQVFSVLEGRLLDILGIRISDCFCFRWKPVPRWGMVSFVTSLGNGYIGFLALWLVISCLRTPSLTFDFWFLLVRNYLSCQRVTQFLWWTLFDRAAPGQSQGACFGPGCQFFRTEQCHIYLLFESLSSRIDGLDPGGGYNKNFLFAFF